MQARLTKLRDTIAPDLVERYRAAKDKGRLHHAMALGIVGLTKRAFNNPGLRPAAWPVLASGKPARLRDTGTLAKSIRVISSGPAGALVGTDRKYAAIHQLGGLIPPHTIRPKRGKALVWPGAAHPVAKVDHPGGKIPARPFFPFYSTGRPTPRAITELERILRARLDGRP